MPSHDLDLQKNKAELRKLFFLVIYKYLLINNSDHIQYVCLPSPRGRSYVLFLLGSQRKDGFCARLYNSVYFSLGKQHLKQGKNLGSTQDCGANNRLFQIVAHEHYTHQNQFEGEGEIQAVLG